MSSETAIIWVVFTETGGHWNCYDTKKEAFAAANRFSAKLDRPFLVRRQDNILYDPVEVKAQRKLL